MSRAELAIQVLEFLGLCLVVMTPLAWGACRMIDKIYAETDEK